MLEEKTIYALATPPGRSAIAVIRLSGPLTIPILKKVFRPKKEYEKFPARRVIKGEIIDLENKELVDEVMVVVYYSPNSYTGEDMAEIFSHGGFYLPQRICEVLKKAGAFLAEPGEFTKRRFLNGKIDLVQAEALLSLISAQTEKQAKMALSQLRGEVSLIIKNLGEELKELLALTEYLIEFAEEEEAKELGKNIKNRIITLKEKIEKIFKKTDFHQKIFQGIRVVLAGRANVGKSSLFNQLLGKERAIVTEIPGTTRDVIEAIIDIDGFPFILCDTAGIDFNISLIDELSVRKTKEYLEKGDIILLIFDISEPPQKADYDLLKMTKEKNRMIILNKKDLTHKFPLNFFNKEPYLLISAKYGEGIEEIVNKLKEYTKNLYSDNETFLFLPRQVECLERVLKILDNISEFTYWEIIAEELKIALDYLKELLGETTNEEILDRIFSQFCIGK
ncbi:MAG: tRNA uridine-5-carboxymethylaminomethyl(34) synthesis GTPase MnmE [candidate division WOR-3 bacterium]|nr:tRNA uridine-5-carboxymethylaminomethyl(34) synthesis GTPase MnmE [candidate division WOR-3 bacterium]MCX7836995.1 tRNA uridine-5-carboxymethylaminomethyl(34) synthesis GTPase MnmE [candidate division WOR-3 bacterium]MDW8114073.1 tRNA uridine-5-carboxymethylaminomethyl(34) synthesis GTPase MnmE [candidate division WOR-3 bacterium]